jgi:hypothetical protein
MKESQYDDFTFVGVERDYFAGNSGEGEGRGLLSYLKYPCSITGWAIENGNKQPS